MRAAGTGAEGPISAAAQRVPGADRSMQLLEYAVALIAVAAAAGLAFLR